MKFLVIPTLTPQDVEETIEAFEVDLERRADEYHQNETPATRSALQSRQNCVVCSHKDRRQIHLRILRQEPQAKIAEDYKIYNRELVRHGVRHLLPIFFTRDQLRTSYATIQWKEKKRFPWVAPPEKHFHWIILQQLMIRDRASEQIDASGNVLRPQNNELALKALDEIRKTVVEMAKLKLPLPKPVVKTKKESKAKDKPAPKQSHFTPEQEIELAIAEAQRQQRKHGRKDTNGDIDRRRTGKADGGMEPASSVDETGEAEADEQGSDSSPVA